MTDTSKIETENKKCKFCKKESSFDPWCCKEYLNYAVDIFNRATSSYLYKVTNGLIGKEYIPEPRK